MPRGYERMRDAYIAEGMAPRDAKRKAASIWNSQHPDNPVNAAKNEGYSRAAARKGKRKKKRMSYGGY